MIDMQDVQKKAPCRRWIITATCLLAFLNVSELSQAKDKTKKPSRGYVDGSFLTRHANRDGRLVEVSLKGPILKVLGKALSGQDHEIEEFLSQIDSIEAFVVSFDKGSFGSLEAHALDMLSQLQRDGWERLAKIRDKQELTTIYALTDGDTIDGLVVLVSERTDPPKLTFTNIAGRIDLYALAQFGTGHRGTKLQISGLDVAQKAVKKGLATQATANGPDSAKPSTQPATSQKSDPQQLSTKETKR